MSFQDLLHSSRRPRYQQARQQGFTQQQSPETVSTRSSAVIDKSPQPSHSVTNHRLNSFHQRIYNPQDSAEFRKSDDKERGRDSFPPPTTGSGSTTTDGCEGQDLLPRMSSSSSSCTTESSFESLRSGEVQPSPRVQSIRENWERKSQFSKLSHETQQFQKIVADLEAHLKRSGESPEAAWKARILVQSTQETDQALLAKLQDHERALLENASENQRASERNTASMACNKLRRDFERSHNALVACLSLYEQRQQAEISQLRATRHEGPEEPDFFDRALRQKELEIMNRKMHQVSNIYQDLAGLVEQQQETIDKLEEDADSANANVKSAADHLHCYGDRREMKEMLLCGAMQMPTSSFEPCGANTHEGTTVDKTISFSDDTPYGIRVTESFRWSMPFETFKEDLQSVRNDIVEVARGIVLKGIQCLQCNSSDTTMW